MLFANNLHFTLAWGGGGRVARIAPAGRRRLARIALIAEGSHGPRAASYPQRATRLIHISTATRHATRAAGLGVYLAQMQLRFLSTGHGTRPAGLVCLSRYKHRRTKLRATAGGPAHHGRRASAPRPAGHVQKTGATCTKHRRTKLRPAGNCFGSDQTFGCRLLPKGAAMRKARPKAHGTRSDCTLARVPAWLVQEKGASTASRPDHGRMTTGHGPRKTDKKNRPRGPVGFRIRGAGSRPAGFTPSQS